MELNKYIDHTLLKPEATMEDIIKLCTEAKEYDFASVCVNPTNVSLAASLLRDSDVKVCTVVGFPLGANTTAVKTFEINDAINNGADEIDMVMNIGAFKSKDYALVLNDITACKKATGDRILKVIIEISLLSDEEIVKACQLAMEAQADFVKTSTGFNKSGATVEAVRLMKKTVGDNYQVKAAGGVRTKEDAINMIEAGATRIGTSGGVAIVRGESHQTGY
ncbi:deoxyribose-phosphate aldolase [Spiroplasma sp. DGKH1]|uniref:deoxyribose-phosphate aldolase n=1 Tax=Spiroplasma sp. DGKH1 TaxID=3050074 RepID=UPI0034C64D1E